MKIIAIRIEKKHFVLPDDYLARATAANIVAGPLVLTSEPDVPDEIQQVWIAHVEGVPPRMQVMRFIDVIGHDRRKALPLQWAEPVEADFDTASPEVFDA